MPRSPEQAHFVVLDGERPREWMPWNSPLSQLKQEIESDDLVLVDAERQRQHFEAKLLLHSREELRLREENDVKRITGVLVDGLTVSAGAKPAGHTDVDFELLCAKLASAGAGALIHQVGFYILIAVDAPLGATFAHFRYELEKSARFTLGPQVEIRIQPVRGDAYLPSAFQAIEMEMMSLCKRWSERRLREVSPHGQ